MIKIFIEEICIEIAGVPIDHLPVKIGNHFVTIKGGFR